GRGARASPAPRRSRHRRTWRNRRSDRELAGVGRANAAGDPRPGVLAVRGCQMNQVNAEVSALMAKLAGRLKAPVMINSRSALMQTRRAGDPMARVYV